jgi:iron complex outermembrane receptor protein
MADTDLGAVAVDAYRNGFSFNLNLSGRENPGTNAIYVLRASDTIKPGVDHTIRAALEYRNNELNAGIVGGTVGYSVYSASMMWDWLVTPAVTFTNSVRMDYLALNYSGALLRGSGLTESQYNNATTAAPSFNAGLVYKVTEDDAVRLTASRGLQVPSLIDFGIDRPPGVLGPYGITGSPTIQPTAVWELELGYDRQLAAIGSMLRTSVFVLRNSDLLTSGLNTLPAPQPGRAVSSASQNTGYSDALGGSVGVSGHSERGFRWNASYAFEVIKDHTTINKRLVTSPQDYQDGTPTSVVILGGGYTWDKLELDVTGRWQSGFTDFGYGAAGLTRYTVSDYATFTARAGYNLTDHLTLALTAQQFNASRLVETSSAPVQRLALVSLTARF